MDGGRQNIARTRPARGSSAPVAGVFEEEAIAPYLHDAARSPGGHSPAIYFPTDEAQVAAVLRQHPAVLCSGARSSLTGGATPRGEVVLSSERMNRIVAWHADSVVVQPGVVLRELLQQAERRGVDYPPAPTYDGATVGGIVATNAAGAATFKYGTTRDWVRRITVVLAGGDVLDLPRGAVACDQAGQFRIDRVAGGSTAITRAAVVPPAVSKLSAGYFSLPSMDLIDLFIGAEGTLGVVTEIELRLLPRRPARAVALVFPRNEAAALELVDELRVASLDTRAAADDAGLDVAAIEYLDTRSLEIVREDRADTRLGVRLPQDAGTALLLQVEWAAAADMQQPLQRLTEILRRHGVDDHALVALDSDERRRAAMFGLREAVPEGVNRRIGERQRQVAASIGKAGADLIVPHAQLAASLREYRRLAAAADLDLAIWGHVSDGNVHPNLLPRSVEEMALAGQILLQMGQAAIDLGGAPMAEHGVGRNPTKQELLRRLYGDAGVASMRAIKRALDPQNKLAPGVLFKTRT